MTKIFISYRRQDSEKLVDSTARILKRCFGEDKVVLDNYTFHLGKDFREEIQQNIISSDVVLVVIGELWLEILQDRLQKDEIDWVRREIEMAFEHKKQVIPLIVDGTSMPEEQVLPESIRLLANCNGHYIRSSIYRLDEDVQRVARKIQQVLGTYVEPRPNTREYVSHLLLNSNWKLTTQSGLDEYICEDDITYRIVVDIWSDEVNDDYSSEWADKFCGPNRTCPVHVKHQGQILNTVHFARIWGSKYLVPLPNISGDLNNTTYYWSARSLSLQIARHIASFHTVYKTLEEFAQYAEIELRE